MTERSPARVPTLDGLACHTCSIALPLGAPAYASDWTVVTPEGSRLVVRYECEGCGTS